MCIGLTGIGIYFAWPYLPWWLIPIAVPVGVGMMWMTLSPITTALLIIIFSVVGVFIDSVLIEPLAWVLEREGVEKALKIISVLLLVLGFHFDLLAS